MLVIFLNNVCQLRKYGHDKSNVSETRIILTCNNMQGIKNYLLLWLGRFNKYTVYHCLFFQTFKNYS